MQQHLNSILHTLKITQLSDYFLLSFCIFFLLHISLPHISIYIKIYQFNKIYGKGVGLQVCKLSYSPPPPHIAYILKLLNVFLFNILSNCNDNEYLVIIDIDINYTANL